MSLEDEWRALVNHLPELSAEGLPPPSIEAITQNPIRDGETPVMVQKIITEILVYTSLNEPDRSFGVQTRQDIEVLGQMRLAEAEKLANQQKKRRRRK